MPSRMIDAIAAHRAAWQAFQDAPTDDTHPDTLDASGAESEALMVLLRTIPRNQQDMQVLMAHLDWWVVEEAQRRECEPEPFALHAALHLSIAKPSSRDADIFGHAKRGFHEEEPS